MYAYKNVCVYRRKRILRVDGASLSLVLLSRAHTDSLCLSFVCSDVPSVEKLCLYVFRENDSKKKRKERSVFVGK